jgi:hypothetical protein
MVVFNIRGLNDYNEAVSADYWTGYFVNFNEIDNNNVKTLKSNTDLNEMFKNITSFADEPVWEALPNDPTDFITAATTTDPIPDVQFKKLGIIELLSGNKILAFTNESIDAVTNPNLATSFVGQINNTLQNLPNQDIRDKILNTVNEPIPFLTCFGYVITRNLLTQYNTNINSSQIRIGVVFVQESSV